MKTLLKGLAMLSLVACTASDPQNQSPQGGPAPIPTVTPSPAAHCNARTGWPAPLEVCSATNPCPVKNQNPIELPTDTPICQTPTTTAGNAHPFFNDGAPQSLVDKNGLTRYYCRFVPPGASSGSKRPLLLWFHGGSGNSANVYEFTALRQKAPSFDLTNDINRAGYILVSIQARNLHWPTTELKHGSHHDFYYREFSSPSENPDIDFTDRVIDHLVASGIVDTQRIYVSGISNGGFFSQYYAIARHTTPTPGGNRVAAAAIYSAADPFQSPNFDQEPSCQLNPYPTSTVPITLFSRNCDLITCNEEQLTRFRTEGQSLLAPGFVVETWVSDIASKVQNSNLSWSILSQSGQKVSACLPSVLCPYLTALINHIRWPDGINDSSALDWEPEMLNFLKAHPL